MVKVALLIGVSEYEPGLNPLPAAVKDVAAMQKILQDPELGGFDEVKALTNPDPQAMQYEVETLFTIGRSKDDLVLLFFSGHGIKDDSNNLYFATRITRTNPKGHLIRSTAVPARFIHEVMNNSRAKRQAIILDCCFSGAFDPALQSKDDGSLDLQEQLGAEGRVVLTSSSSIQYSFEQQGSELSLYTRYLVEGIETGAADRDENGKISMRELHDYATSKVQETAPNMTPKLITLKDMGFDIVLAKAKVTDPKLRYRRQVERYASRGVISSIGRTILDKLQTQLDLSVEVTREIEAEVLRPYQERLENLQRYQQTFIEAVKHEYPLSSHVQSELEDLLEILGLRKEDVGSIEQEIVAQAVQKLETEPQDEYNVPNMTQSSASPLQSQPQQSEQQVTQKQELPIWFELLLPILVQILIVIIGIRVHNSKQKQSSTEEIHEVLKELKKLPLKDKYVTSIEEELKQRRDKETKERFSYSQPSHQLAQPEDLNPALKPMKQLSLNLIFVRLASLMLFIGIILALYKIWNVYYITH